MSRSDEISSTERLLDLIRQKETNRDAPFQDLYSGSQEFGIKFAPFRRIWPSKRKTIFACEVTPEDINLAKVVTSGEQSRLANYGTIPVDPEIHWESPQFPRYLRSVLKDFAGSTKDFELWFFMASPQVEIRNIRIPRVPKKQISSAVYWTFKRSVSFDENKNIFDFEVLGEISEGRTKKTEVNVYTVPKDEIEEVKEVFYKSGFSLTGICISPFDIQNLIRAGWMAPGEGTIAAVHIAADWSLISIFSSGNIVIARFIRTGVSSMSDAIMEELKEGKADSLALEEKEEIPQPIRIEGEPELEYEKARKLLFSLKSNAQPLEVKPGYYLNGNDIFRMIEPPLDRLIRQIERSFKYYDSNFEGGGIRKIFIGGEICSLGRVLEYISDQLGTPYDIIDPFASDKTSLSEFSAPESANERVSYAHVVGTALSDKTRTPNCIFTYKDKERVESISRINKGIFAAFLLLVSLSFGLFLWQEHISTVKESKIENLQNKLTSYSPKLDQPHLIRLAGKVTRKMHILDQYAGKYSALAVLGELSRITPSYINLLGVQAGFGPPPEVTNNRSEKYLILEGVVVGGKKDPEGALGTYLMKLEDSLIFFEPGIKKTERRVFAGEELFYFAVSLQID